MRIKYSSIKKNYGVLAYQCSYAGGLRRKVSYFAGWINSIIGLSNGYCVHRYQLCRNGNYVTCYVMHTN